MKLIFDDGNVRGTALQLLHHCEEFRGKTPEEVREFLLTRMRLFYKDYPNEECSTQGDHQHPIYANVYGYPGPVRLPDGGVATMVSLFTRIVVDKETSLSACDLDTLQPVRIRS